MFWWNQARKHTKIAGGAPRPWLRGEVWGGDGLVETINSSPRENEESHEKRQQLLNQDTQDEKDGQDNGKGRQTVLVFAIRLANIMNIV